MFKFLLLCGILPIITSSSVKREIPESSVSTIINELPNLVKYLPPDVRGKSKGNGGWICIVGGSEHHSGPVYLSAISALKVGADIVTVLAPKGIASIIKTYSPDIVVLPYFNTDTISKMIPIIKKYDVIMIGAGLVQDEETTTLIYDVINTCKKFQKPIILDAVAVNALSKNPTILKDYPGPVIMTPNHEEVESLIKGLALTNNSAENWYDYWGSNITILMKGETDRFHTNREAYNWVSNEGGTFRRCPGQGNILAGALGTVFNWALKNEAFIDKDNFPHFSQSVATYAAAKLTRYSNSRAFEQYGRSLIASNMIDNLHLACKDVFDW